MLKKLFIFTFMLSAVLLFSQITDVTVYKDRALVTRVYEEQGSAGTAEAVFKNISLNANLDSIRAKGFTGKESSLKIIDIRVEKNYKKISGTELEALKKDIEIEKNNIAKFNAGKIRVAEQKKNIAVFSEQTKDAVNDNLNRGNFNAKQWEDALNIYAVKLQKLDEELFFLNDEIKKSNEKLAVLEDKFRQYSSGNNIFTLDVFVKYLLEKNSLVKIELSYQAYGAGWQPVYDSRFDSRKKEVVIEYFAKVFQNTGEDWKNVSLTLSTARPDLSGRAPEINPWLLDFSDRTYRVDTNAYRKKESRELEESKSAPAMSAAGDELKKEDLQLAEVEIVGTAVNYNILSKADVIHGKKDIKVIIASSIKLSPELSWVIVPRYNNASFLNAKVKNDSLYTFLSGEISLYSDDTFIGKSAISEINPGQELEFSLGRDPRISSELKLENTEKTKIFSKKKEKRRYLITITNNSAETVDILVKDVLPKSLQTNKVSVRIIKVEPDTKDIESGSVYKWNFKLEKNTKIKIIEEWEVEYPEEGYIIGL